MSKKVSRNEPCPCGSGKKFKSCCDGRQSNDIRPAVDLDWLQQQAHQAVSRSNYVEAEQYFRQLTKAKPSDAYFQASLGQALCWLRRRKEGAGCLLQAAKLLGRQSAKTRDPRFLIELSGQLMHWGEATTGEKLARIALALAPDSPATLINLVMCLTRVNRDKEALPLAQRVCRLLPDAPSSNILLAIVESRLQQPELALARLEKVIENNIDSTQTARAWLEKAAILDRLGRYSEAYMAMQEAGQRHAALSSYTPQQKEHIFNVLDANFREFDSTLLQRWPIKVLDDGLPIPAFLLGFLRSGTTLTEQVLGSHPSLIVTDESTIIHEVTEELERISGIVNDHGKALKSLSILQIKQLRQFYWQRMREEYGDEVMTRQLVDKNALNTIELGVISVVFPEAKILFALRDPRDICLSCFQQAFGSSPATVNLTSLPGIARQYAEVMKYWLALRELMQPRYIQVRYEDTVGDFETTFRGVLDFLGVDWNPAIEKFHERAKGRFISTPSFSAVSQPLYNSAVKRWPNYRSHFEPVMATLQPYLDAFGYQD